MKAVPDYQFAKTFSVKLLLLTFMLVGVIHGVQADEEAILQRLNKLERALDNQGLLDLFQQLESLQAEVQSLRGQLEEQQYTIERLRKSQRDAYVDLDRRLQESLMNGGAPNTMSGDGLSGQETNPPLTVYQPGEQPEVAGTPAPGIDVEVQQGPALNPPANEFGAANTPPMDGAAASGSDPALGANNDQSAVQMREEPALPEPSMGTTEGQPGDTPPLSADQAYREAFGLLKAGKYDESIDAFNLFLLDYPNSEFADNSQYWLGETYFVKQDYPAAIEQYRNLITNYPDSKKQSHALLKIGYSFQRLGEPEKARAVLQDLQTRYPGSTAARLAAERLQQIAAETTQ